MGLKCELDMSLDEPSDEAVARENNARLIDLAFAVRRAARSHLTNEDAYFLARTVQILLERGEPLSREAIAQQMVKSGRTPHAAEQLSSKIFPKP